jgi:riboflavin kinase/FMN adenylyltransferase
MKKILYPAAVTIGIFDGVHKGHQAILKRLTEEAKKARLKSVVITFDPHPAKVLNQAVKIPFLISLEHRIKLIKKMGVDTCFIVKFTKEFSRLSPEDFIKEILIDKFGLKVLVAGENFLFGAKERGSLQLLKSLGKKYGFKECGVRPLKMYGDFISSTRIRKAVEKGDLDSASKMLGRPVTILGTVVRGKKVGREIGFPTANIDPHHESIPPSGVYSVDVKLDGRPYRGILNISRRKVIEAHIFNFNRNIYGGSIEVIFKKKIRDEKKFKSLEALKRQIHKDILCAP